MSNSVAVKDRLWIVACLLGVGLLVVSAIGSDSVGAIPWYIGTISAGVTVALLGRSRISGRALELVLWAYTFVTALFAIALGSPLPLAQSHLRVQLYSENPNLLAADLTMAVAALMMIRPRTHLWLAALPLSVWAIFYTGSRTALLAVIASTLAWGVLGRASRWTRYALGALAFILSLFAGIVIWQLWQDRDNPNLLAATATFASPEWRRQFAEEVRVETAATPGPFPNSVGDRIRATSGVRGTLTLYQSVEVSREGEPYIASIYLRSKVPQRITIDTQLSSVTCNVSDEWMRCTTPVGYGDGNAYAQLQIRSNHPGDTLDIFAYGPQLEYGENVSDYSETLEPLIPSRFIERYFSSNSIALDPMRREAMGIAWEVFLDNYAVGVGKTRVVDRISSAIVGDTSDIPQHSHNQLLERLASEGLVGALGWILVFVSTYRRFAGGLTLGAIPLLVAVVLLNVWDATFFHSVSFFSYWIAVSVSGSREFQRANRHVQPG